MALQPAEFEHRAVVRLNVEAKGKPELVAQGVTAVKALLLPTGG